MQARTELLVPRPRQATSTSERLSLSAPIRIRVDAPAALAASAVERLQQVLPSSDAPTSGPEPPLEQTLVTLRHIGEPGIGRDAYRLAVGAAGVEILASSASGLFYGVETLAQWIRQHSAESTTRSPELSGLQVDDAPAFEHRGVLIDISRNKVPTMETLFALVDLLASWKINQLQLYTEHTFAYRGHEVVWEGWSPITADEIRSLDVYCQERHIELVPNQQSFGHFHRWLVHEPYRRFAECPAGVEHPFSDVVEPFSLCPADPASLALLEELYAELLPSFSSRLFNVGLDETLDLGKGGSARACEKRGRHSVYLDFLNAVHRLAARHDRRIQFWADILLEQPKLSDRIPEDAIALDWGYEADHPFAEEAAKLAASGRDYYVCPGSSSWNSFAGRAQNALENLASAARSGHQHGANGYLVTDWGDNGHLQPLAASYLGFLAGAAFAWRPPTETDSGPSGWHRLLDLHAFGEPQAGLGRIAMALANIYLATGTPSKNGTALFHLVMSPNDPLEHGRYSGLSIERLEMVLTAIAHARDDLTSVRQGPDLELLAHELRWAAEAIDLGARIGLARLEAEPSADLSALDKQVRRELFSRTEILTEELRPVWLARNREGGLERSIGRLERTRELLG